MPVIRSILLWILYIPWVVICFVPIVCSVLVPPIKRHKFTYFCNVCVLYLIKKTVGLDYTVSGTDNIPSGPAIICCKHQSAYETLVLQKIFPYQVFIIKKELLYVPFLGLIFYIMNYIPISRKQNKEAGRRQLMYLARDRRDAGFWITIFPEGTRVPPGKIGTYKFGAAKLARELKMDIIPVATNSGEYWPKGIVKYPGKAKFAVGPPISYQDGTPEEITAKCAAWIESKQRQIEGSGPCGPQTVSSS